jgi:hypothetical protein
MLAGMTTFQTAVSIGIAVLSALVGVFKINGRAGRLRSQIKDILEISKLASDANCEAAREASDQIALAQLERLRKLDEKQANRTYDKSSLGVVVFLLLIGVPLAWALTLPGWVVTNVFAVIVALFLLIFVPFGIAQFLTGGKFGTRSP